MIPGKGSAMSNERIERAYAEISQRAEADLEQYGAKLDRASRLSKRADWYWYSFIGAMLVGIFVLTLLIVRGDGVPNAKRQQACDILVQRLLATDNLVELQRDEWLVHQLSCAVHRRTVPVIVP